MLEGEDKFCAFLADRLGRSRGLHHEQTEFVKNYSECLLEAIETEEARILHSVDEMKKQIQWQRTENEIKKNILSKVGLFPQIPYKKFEDLVKLSILLNCSQLDESSLFIEFEKFIESCRDTTETLDKTSQLEGEIKLRLADAAHLSEQVERCEKEFTQYGKREYQDGIEAIQNNSTIVSQKASEYKQKIEEAITTLSKYSTLNDLGCFGEEWGRLKGLRKELNNIKVDLEPYNELPPDPTLAKVELEQARLNLRHLLAKRDGLLMQLLKNQSK